MKQLCWLEGFWQDGCRKSWAEQVVIVALFWGARLGFLGGLSRKAYSGWNTAVNTTGKVFTLRRNDVRIKTTKCAIIA
jgi:hypothetical protein